MKIVRVTATPLNVPLHIELVGLDKKTSLACCYVEVETDDGIIGHGFTSITEEDVIGQIVNGVIAPNLVGDDPLLNERIWKKLYWTMMPRGQTGYAAHALAAVDLALWDIKGKALNLPVWKLLGGARDRVPVYATFGFGFFDREQLAAAAKEWVKQGFRRLKMTVATDALRHRDSRPIIEAIREDARRVQAVREAVGPETEIFIDANCNLDLYHASKLAEMVKPYNISFFEEPITQNDALAMAQLRRASGYAFAHFDPPFGKVRWIAHLKTEAEFLGFFVEQKNREYLVIDYSAHHGRDPAQSRVQIERRGQYVGHVQQQRLNRQLPLRLR